MLGQTHFHHKLHKWREKCCKTLKCIITGNKMLVYKVTMSKLKCNHSSRRILDVQNQKGSTSSAIVEVVLALSFSILWLANSEFLRQNHTVNEKYFLQVNAVCMNRSMCCTKNILLHICQPWTSLTIFSSQK